MLSLNSHEGVAFTHQPKIQLKSPMGEGTLLQLSFLVLVLKYLPKSTMSQLFLKNSNIYGHFPKNMSVGFGHISVHDSSERSQQMWQGKFPP